MILFTGQKKLFTGQKKLILIIFKVCYTYLRLISGDWGMKNGFKYWRYCETKEAASLWQQ